MININNYLCRIPFQTHYDFIAFLCCWTYFLLLTILTVVFTQTSDSHVTSALPSSLGDNHFRANLVEPFPQVGSLQVHPGLLPGAGAGAGAGDQRGAQRCGLRALQQRVLALRWTGDTF